MISESCGTRGPSSTLQNGLSKLKLATEQTFNWCIPSLDSEKGPDLIIWWRKSQNFCPLTPRFQKVAGQGSVLSTPKRPLQTEISHRTDLQCIPAQKKPRLANLVQFFFSSFSTWFQKVAGQRPRLDNLVEEISKHLSFYTMISESCSARGPQSTLLLCLSKHRKLRQCIPSLDSGFRSGGAKTTKSEAQLWGTQKFIIKHHNFRKCFVSGVQSGLWMFLAEKRNTVVLLFRLDSGFFFRWLRFKNQKLQIYLFLGWKLLLSF